jgi:hypothetical protein
VKVEGKEVPQWVIEAAEIWVRQRTGGFQAKDLIKILNTSAYPMRVADRLIQKFKKEGKIALYGLWWFPKGHKPIGR